MKGNFFLLFSFLWLSAVSSFAAAPPLSILQLPNSQLQISWPGTTAGFSLEQASSLNSPVAWQSVEAAVANRGGVFSVTIPVASQTRFFRLRRAAPVLAIIAETAPAAGESGVAVTRETIFRFSAPLAPDTVLTGDELFAEFGGRELLSRAELSLDRKTATLFYLENLPASARVRVSLNAAQLRDASGQPLDADGDGQPGGTRVLEFNTAGITGLPGTAVIGKVFASDKNADGSNKPLPNVTITVDGAEESLRTATDATGAFTLSPAPAGRFFVHVDGRTAIGSQWPGGAYYPFVGKAWEAVAGKTNNLAGGSGEIFLPLIQSDALKAVSASEETRVTFAPSLLATNPSLAGVEIMVPANALFSDNGTRGGKVGMAPVPPDRLPEPLPPGLNMPLVITVQTDGGSNFDVPVPVKFPNLPDPVTGVKLGPGAKTALWSFNHDTGRWEIQGTATISADGQFAVTDPGVGIRQPGWAGMNPGSPGGGGPCPNCPPPKPPNCDDAELKLAFTAADCATDGVLGAVIATPVLGCAVGGALNSLRVARDCFFLDLEECGPSAKNNLISTAVGCIPFVGGPLNMGMCLGATGNGINEYQMCFPSAAASLASLRHAAAVFPEISFKLNEAERLFQQQEEVSFALRDLNTMLLGSPVWSNVRLESANDPFHQFFENFLAALKESSPGGTMITVEERAALLLLPVPDGVTAADVTALVDRFQNIGPAGLSLPPNAANLQVYDRVEAALAKAAADGWKTFYEGAIRGLAILSDLFEPLPPGLFGTAIAVGNPVFPPGQHHYAIVNLETGFTVRGRLNSGSVVDNLIFAPNTYYLVSYYMSAPLTLPFPVFQAAPYIGTAVFKSGGTGDFTRVLYARMVEDTGSDRDLDGLSDHAEFVLGTSPFGADADGDGISDGQELQSGTDPLDGQIASPGLIAALNTPGNAIDVTAWNDLAAVADSESGVALFSVANPQAPTLLAQIDTPGSAISVAGAGDRLAVADNDAGVAWFDVSSPASPTLLFQKPLGSPVKVVTVLNGFVVAGVNFGELVLLNESGDILQRLQAGTGVIQDLVACQGRLYVLQAGKLHTLTLTDQTLAAVNVVDSPGSATSATPSRERLSCDGDRLFVTHSQGYNVFSLANPLAPALVRQWITPLTFGWKQVVADGSGLALAAVGLSSNERDVTLYNVGPDGMSTLLQTTFATPGVANAVHLHQGLGLIADGTGGLLVLSYATPDGLRQPPTITLAGAFQPGPATQMSGQRFRLLADARDDVRVRNVEFFLDGARVSNDSGRPYELDLLAPIRSAAKTSFTVQARATDTGGNSTFTALQTITLIPETLPPMLTSLTPTNNSRLAPFSFSAITATFDERLLPSSVTGANLQLELIEGTTTSAVPFSVTLSASQTRVTVAFTPLENSGANRSLRLTFLTGLRDLSGNGLPAPIVAEFILAPVNGLATGNLWNTAANWLAGLPTASTPVQLGVAGAPREVQLNAPVVGQAFSLVAHDNLTLLNGLNVVQDAVFHGLLTFSGQSSVTAGGTVDLLGGGEATGGNGGAALTALLARNFGTFLMNKDSSSSALQFGGTTVFRNEPGAVFDLRAGEVRVVLGARFENHGTLMHAGAAPALLVSGSFQNFGRMEVQSGEMGLLGGSENFGVTALADGATLRLGNGGVYGIPTQDTRHNFAASSRLEGSGTLLVKAAAVQFNGPVDFAGPIRFEESRGSITFNGVTRLRRSLDLRGEITTITQGTRRGNDVTFSGLSAQFDAPVTMGTNSTLTFNQSIPATLPGLDAGEQSSVLGSGGVVVTGPATLRTATLSGAGALRFDGPTAMASLTTQGPNAPAAPKVIEFNGVTSAANSVASRVTHFFRQTILRVQTNGVLDITRGEDWRLGSTPGTVRLENLGTLRHSASNLTTFGFAVLNSGRFELPSGELRLNAGPVFTQTAGLTVIQGGHLNGDVVVQGGVFRLESGQFSGSLTYFGGALEFPSGTTLAGPLRISGGVLDIAPPTLTVASIVQTNGTLRLNGGTLICSAYQFQRPGILTGHGIFDGRGGGSGEVSPGSPLGVLTFTGSYNFENGGRFVVEIGGTTPATEFDQLKVSDIAFGSNTTLDIRLVNGFSPVLGAEFPIIVKTGTRTRSGFETVTGAAIGTDRRFEVVYDATGVKLRVVAQ